MVALPAAAFAGLACLSLVWADELQPAVELLAYFTVPFALLLAVLARSPFPDWAPRTMARAAIGLGALFAVIGLYQAVTRNLFFFAPNLEVSNANSSFFRVTSLFGDPSLYGRHVVLAMAVLLVCLALQRIDLRLGIGLLVVLWLGLFFSYSQSSMVALVSVTLAVAFATGGPQVRKLVVGGLAVVLLLVVGFLASVEIRGESLRRETSDRTQRIQDTARVIKEEPVIGVGIGNQAQASRRLSGRDRPTPNFVSHATPLTVAAELGVIGLAAVRVAARRGRPGDPRRLAPGARPRAGAGRLPARAVRARPVLFRLPGGPADLGRAGGGGGPAHVDPARRRRAQARARTGRRVMSCDWGSRGRSPARACWPCWACCWRSWP
ncbi:MAG: O-antigen ligase family protein [Thermoleophilaceae bacterium]